MKKNVGESTSKQLADDISLNSGAAFIMANIKKVGGFGTESRFLKKKEN